MAGEEARAAASVAPGSATPARLPDVHVARSARPAQSDERVLRVTPDELVRMFPRLRPYTPTPSPGWREIVDAADWLRHDLSVSKSLWSSACLAMGREQAAIALAVVSTKSPSHFRTSAGAYFHGMVAKAKAGELNLDRTIWDLRARMN